MADPFTIGLMAVSVGTGIAGAAVSASGAQQKGDAEGDRYMAESQAYKYKAGVAEINKNINLQNSDYERKLGEVVAQRSGMESRVQAGQIKTIQGAGGLDVNSGSNRAVQESQHDIGVHNQRTVRSDAARRAYGFEVKALENEAERDLATMSSDYSIKAASSARRGGEINAISSILGGASSVSSKWLGWQSKAG